MQKPRRCWCWVLPLLMDIHALPTATRLRCHSILLGVLWLNPPHHISRSLFLLFLADADGRVVDVIYCWFPSLHSIASWPLTSSTTIRALNSSSGTITSRKPWMLWRTWWKIETAKITEPKKLLANQKINQHSNHQTNQINSQPTGLTKEQLTDPQTRHF